MFGYCFGWLKSSFTDSGVYLTYFPDFGMKM